MTEPKIRDYLLDLIRPDELIENLSKLNDTFIPYWKKVDMIQEGEFEITLEHLIKICDDVLSNKLAIDHLYSFAFIIIGSDYFTWDVDKPNGNRISEVLFEWNNEAINYPLILENVKQWRNYLLGGERLMTEGF